LGRATAQKRRIFVYKVSRTYLLDLLLREMQNETVRIRHGVNSVRAYEQLTRLEIEFKQDRMVYKCPLGHHDDLAMSCAMLAWAAQHPHREVVLAFGTVASCAQQTARPERGRLDLTFVWCPVQASGLGELCSLPVTSTSPATMSVQFDAARDRALLLLPTCLTARGNIRASPKS
jgi:hypothetical protein